MSHTVAYNSETHIIETRVQGILTMEEAREIIFEIIQAGKANNCYLCLSDYRAAELDLSVLELYGVPKIISSESASQGLLANKFKRAIVVKHNLRDFHFFETVTLNSGQNAKLFEDIDEAKKWLSNR
jgi:hypothetical protein